MPKLRHKFFGNQLSRLRNSIITLVLAGTFAILIYGPYLYQVNQLLKDTVSRGGGNFEFSTNLDFHYVDTIGSLVFPPLANPEGWYYCGILSVLLILLYYFSGLAGVYSSYIKVPQLETQKNLYWYRDPWVKIFFLAWASTITYITYGSNSYLFTFLWKYMPFFSRLRAWSRMNIILVPIIAWLLAISYSHFEKLICQNNEFPNKRRAIYVLLGVYVAILIIQYYFFINKLYHKYWTNYFQDVASKDLSFLIFGAFALLIILVLLNLASKINFQSPRLLWRVLTFFILFSALDMRGVGTSMWMYTSPLAIPQRYKLNVEQLNIESFTVPRIERGTLSLTSAFSVGNKKTKNLDWWYFNRYVQFLENTENQPLTTNLLRLNGCLDFLSLFAYQQVNIGWFLLIDPNCLKYWLKNSTNQYTKIAGFNRLKPFSWTQLKSVSISNKLTLVGNWNACRQIAFNHLAKLALLLNALKLLY